MESVFDKKTLKDIHEDIKKVYLIDNRPWIIGYSGGKDSTTALQLIWNAIREIDVEKRRKPIKIISSDTRIETPTIIEHLIHELEKTNNAARKQNLPFMAKTVSREEKDSFWVNLIGRGYPAPTTRFRWCTDRLKINPANDYIKNEVSKRGEVVIVLGVRESESVTRKQAMNLEERKITGSSLSRHSSLPQAYVYAPIKDFSIDDVWTYLLQNNSPWGGDNNELAAMYRLFDGECPLVIDRTTPSCGNSRFGCWCCSVVDTDKTLQPMIDEGKHWVIPLRKFRNLLKKTQIPEEKHKYRRHKRRDGQIYLKKKILKTSPKGKKSREVVFDDEGTVELSFGPYTFQDEDKPDVKGFFPSFREHLLRELLKTQKRIQKERNSAEFQLISLEELIEIKHIWRNEGDWADSVTKIYKEIYGITPDWVEDDSIKFTPEDKEILQRISQEVGINHEILVKLIDLEIQLQSMKRRASIFIEMDKIFKEEWRDPEEIIKTETEVYKTLKQKTLEEIIK